MFNVFSHCVYYVQLNNITNLTSWGISKLIVILTINKNRAVNNAINKNHAVNNAYSVTYN